MNNRNFAFRMHKLKKFWTLLLFAGVFFGALPAALKAHPPSASAPEIFNYAELELLYNHEQLPPAVADKLSRLLTIPFVDNSVQISAPARLRQSPKIGEFLRVACWNIERGLEYEAIEAAFGDAAKFEAMLDSKKFPPGSEARREVLEQAAALRAADVIVLNEVDFGVKRTGYRDVAGDLARRLGMNYAFGVQFVELSAVHFTQEPARGDRNENEILEHIRVDRERYKGLHGIAILSRYPLENVRLVPFKEQPYDWYKSEKKGTGSLEKGKRKISKAIFLEETTREIRRGGRTTLLADIADARFPGGRVTVAATHLENRTKPANRLKQLEELLANIKEIRHPVILAGDMNTSTEDLTPISLRRLLTKHFGSPKFWAKQVVTYALGIGMVEGFINTAVGYWLRQADPTVRSIPLFAPNSEEKFFRTLKKFRFADGGAFDFRGERARSTGGLGSTLSDSNERGSKGFVTTYQVERPIKFIGKYKLDWFFVKPANLKKPDDKQGSYLFAPHFGRTLADINNILTDESVSDHRPMIVDLPLGEPDLGEDVTKRKDQKK